MERIARNQKLLKSFINKFLIIFIIGTFYYYFRYHTNFLQYSASIKEELLQDKEDSLPENDSKNNLIKPLDKQDKQFDKSIKKVVTPKYFDKQPLWNNKLDLKSIETMLENEKIVSYKKMSDYFTQQNKVYSSDNNVYLVVLQNGLKAVFKPGEDRFAEVAAYRACKFLGHRLVPPTILRTINKQKGSLQFFVESDIDLLKDNSYFTKINPKDISDMKLFYFIFGQWDINSGNQIIQQCNDKFFLALIDNAGMINLQQARYGDFAFVRRGYSDKRNDPWNVPFPFDKPSCLKNPTLKQINKLFDFMSKEEKLRYYNRYKYSRITYCFWRNSIWVQYYKNTPNVTPNYTNQYFKSTLEAYKRLDKKFIESFWTEGSKELEKNRLKQIIEGIIDRKNQVLKHAQMNPCFIKNV